MKCLPAKTAFGSADYCKLLKCLPANSVFGSPEESSRRDDLGTVKGYRLVKCSPAKSFHKSLEMMKDSNNLVRPLQKREGLKIPTFISN